MRHPQLQELEGSPGRRRLLGGSRSPEGLLSREGRVVASVCAPAAVRFRSFGRHCPESPGRSPGGCRVGPPEVALALTKTSKLGRDSDD